MKGTNCGRSDPQNRSRRNLHSARRACFREGSDVKAKRLKSRRAACYGETGEAVCMPWACLLLAPGVSTSHSRGKKHLAS